MNRPHVPADHPAVHLYLAVGIGAAALLGLVLLERGAGMWIVWPPLIAAAGLAFRWVAAPAFTLLGTAVALLNAPQFFWSQSAGTDTALAVALVGYTMSHFRLCSMAKSLYPPDTRRVLGVPQDRQRIPFWLELLMFLTVLPYVFYVLRRWQLATWPQVPPITRPTPPASDELPKALLATILAGIAGVALWAFNERWQAPLLTHQVQWQIGVVVWVILMIVVSVALYTWYRSSARMTATQARLILNEALWRDTRADQRSTSRWIQWARLKQDSQVRRTT